jgi:hypothetical protein
VGVDELDVLDPVPAVARAVRCARRLVAVEHGPHRPSPMAWTAIWRPRRSASVATSLNQP